jgi:hypothetical protein
MWALSSKPSISNSNPYHSSDYIHAHHFLENDELTYLTFTSSTTNVFAAFFKRAINDGWSELIDPYGYGGFAGEGKLTLTDMNKLKIFLKSRSILNLFIRHNPSLHNAEKLPKTHIEFNRKTYVIECQRHGSAENRNSINAKFRRSLRRASRVPLTVTIENLDDSRSNYDKFKNLYRQTMLKRKAAKFYFFNDNFFEKLILCKYPLKLITVFDAEKIIRAAAIIILDKANSLAYYHLGASNGENHEMEFLFSEMANYLHHDGIKYFNLGGGLSSGEDDGLSAFKRKLSDLSEDFYVSKFCTDHKYSTELRLRLGISASPYFLVSEAIDRKRSE